MLQPAQPIPSAPPIPAYDRSFGYIAYGLLLATILLSTYAHHLRPDLLNVPSNREIASWRNPALEETTLADRMTPEQRALLLSEGVPQSTSLGSLLFGDILSLALGWLCFVHARRHYGFWMASCFLVGSFVFTGLEESMWILLGRFGSFGSVNAVNAFGEPVCGTYWFTKGVLWFLETPVTACVGWFYIAYACVLVAGKVFPRMGLLGRATVGGLIAMGIDLWMDPVVTSPEMVSWVWAKGDVFLFFGIPHTNFVGWFLLIFLFAIFWEKLPGMEQKWGRPKATALFFLGLFATEIGILVFFLVWMPVLGKILSAAGTEHAVRIPEGW
ncbi:MAG: carotenoid biosynthesis protein [bacterium]